MTIWTLDEAKKAQKNYQFIMVTNIGTPLVQVKDFMTVWSLEPLIAFHTGYRIGGKREDIQQQLESSVDKNLMDEILSTLITKDNYNKELRLVFKQELDEYNSWRFSVLKSNIEKDGMKLADIIQENPLYMEKFLNITEKGRTISKPVKKGKALKKTLIEKINNLPSDRVLDVSELKEDGSGVRMVKRPTRTRKITSPNLPLISKDKEHYLLAIDMLPGGRDKYIEDVKYIQSLELKQ